LGIVVVEYDPNWPRFFESLKKPIADAVSDIVVSVAHVGSTAVPGLAAKPVIDMDVIVRARDIATAIARIQALGYEHLGDLGIPERDAFRAPSGARPHNLYVCPSGSQALANHLGLRDYLRTRPDAARDYGELKKRLALDFPNDAEAYVRGKTRFIIAILREIGFTERALAEIEALNPPPRAKSGAP
jgi:GrpB-like predicted nucleotidyltransferase (UPF0157 family)